MSILSFPSNPTVGQEFTADNGQRYTWTGNRWQAVVGTGGQPDRLVAGNKSLVLDSNGIVTLPAGATLVTSPGSIDITAGAGGYAELLSHDNNKAIWVDDNGSYVYTNGAEWSFKQDGYIRFPGTTTSGIESASTLQKFKFTNVGPQIVAANNHTWTFGDDGTLTLPGGVSKSAGSDFYWSSPSSNDANHWGSWNLNWGVTGFTSTLQMNKNNVLLGTTGNIPINISANGHQWQFKTDGYLVGSSLELQGYLKGVDGSTGTTGQILTRQSNGGIAWADAPSGGSGGATDRLTNGSNNLILESDGSLTAPYGKLGLATGEIFGIVADADTAATVQSNNGTYAWGFGIDGTLNLPESTSENIAIIQSTNSIQINANGKYWSFAVDGNLTLPENGDILDINGSSVLGGGGISDRLTNGDNTVVLDDNNKLKFSNTPSLSQSYIQPGLSVFGDTNISVVSNWAVEGKVANLITVGNWGPFTDRVLTVSTSDPNASTTIEWVFDTNGNLTIPVTGDITRNGVSAFASSGGTLWTNEANGCLRAELSDTGFQAFTAGTHLDLQDGGIWNVGSYQHGVVIGNDGFANPNDLSLRASDSVFINTNTSDGYDSQWMFSNKILQLPNDGDIVRWNGSEMVSVLGAGSYILPTASDTVLGGVKVGYGLTVDNDGVLSVTQTSAVTISDTAPTLDNGFLWFNSDEGRTYVRYNDQWIDANPTVLPLPVEPSRLANGDAELALDANGSIVVGKPTASASVSILGAGTGDIQGYPTLLDIVQDNSNPWAFTLRNAQAGLDKGLFVYVTEEGDTEFAVADNDNNENILTFNQNGYLTLENRTQETSMIIGTVADRDNVVWANEGEYLGVWFGGNSNFTSGGSGYGPTVSVNVGYVIDDGDYTPEHQDHKPEMDLVNVNVLGANWNFRADGNITLPNGGVIGVADLTEGTGVVIATHPNRYYTFDTAYFEDGNGSVTTGNARYFECGVQVTTNGEYIITSYNPGNSWVVGHQLIIDGVDLDGNSGTHDLTITVTGVDPDQQGVITSISVTGRGVGRTILFGSDGTINNAIIDGGNASTWLHPDTAPTINSPEPLQAVKTVLVPVHSTGASGDKKGDTAFDENFMYYCTKDYTTGTDNIWVKNAWTANAW